MKTLNIIGLSISIVFYLFISACAPTEYQTVSDPIPTLDLRPVLLPEVVLQPGDEIEIKFYYHSDLNEHLFILPDGNISLRLINEIHVAGKTPKALEEELKKRYAKFLKEPSLTVLVRNIHHQKVYIGGEVEKPMVLSYTTPITLLQAIYQAGGLKETAYRKQVLLLRYKGNRNPEIYQVDVKELLKSGQGDIFLSPYDVVHVPKSPIAKVNQFVKQYIDGIIPSHISAMFGLTYEINKRY